MPRIGGLTAGFARRAAGLFRRSERLGPGDLLRRARETGGFSWNPSTGKLARDGYMVAIRHTDKQFPEAILRDPEAFAREFDRYLMENRAAFEGDPDRFLGGWLNEGSLTVEQTQNVVDREAAIRLGEETNQIAIYDVKGQTTIDTGGTGDIT